MLSRLFTRARLKTFTSVPFFQGATVRPSTRLNSNRLFRTSSHFQQRYRYVRFNDGPYGRGSSGGSSFFSWWYRLGPVQRLAFVGFGGGAPLFYVTHLETVEETGRRRFIFMSRSMEESLGKAGFQQVMRAYGNKLLPEDHPITKTCRQVVSRLGAATGREGVDWKVYVIDEPIPNAFVIPGGQIFVFTGILPIAANDSGLATILGHEIAHYTLRHIAEKTSSAQFFGIIGFVIAWTLGLPLDSFYRIQQIALELPNSRACETEADYVGLLYMAKACYNPEEGPKVWERMAKMAKGQPKIPQFLSTHPENQDRQARLQGYMREATEKGIEAGCGNGFGNFVKAFRDGMW